MRLDELDLTRVPEAAVRAARAEATPGSSAWVVSMGDATGLLVTSADRASWFFPSLSWSMLWTAMKDTRATGDAGLLVGDADGEEYGFTFRSAEERDRFLSERHLAGRPAFQPRRPAASTPMAEAASHTLALMFGWGLALTAIAALIVVAGAPAIGVLVAIPAQIFLGIAIIGTGVKLGMRAASLK